MGELHMSFQKKFTTSDQRVIQTFTIRLGGSVTKDEKRTRGYEPSKPTRGMKLDQEVITSEHMDVKNPKIAGRHGG